MPSLAKQAKKLARAIDRQRLREIKQRLREIRRTRPERIRSIRAACRTGRENLRTRVAALREQTRAELRARIQALREAQRGTCRRSEASARNELNQQIERAARELELETGRYRESYGRKGPRPRVSAKERREESDDEVRRNLPAELVAVFDRVRRDIKPSPRRSRTEAFLEWVHDNPDEAHAIVYDAIEQDVAKLIAEQDAIERRARGRYSAEHVMDVPF